MVSRVKDVWERISRPGMDDWVRWLILPAGLLTAFIAARLIVQTPAGTFILVIALAVAGAAILWNPIYGLLVYTFLILIDYGKYSFFEPVARRDLLKLIILWTLASYLMRILFRRSRLPELLTAQNLMILGLILLFAFSFTYARDLGSAWSAFQNFGKSSLVYFLAAGLIVTRRHFRLFAGTWIASAVTLSLLTLSRLAGQPFQGSDPAVRFASAEKMDPNQLAVVIALALPLLVYFAVSQVMRRMRILYLGIACLCITAIIFSYSRTGLALVIVLAGIIALRYRFDWRVIIVFALLVALGAMLLPAGTFQRVERLQNVGSTGEPGIDSRIQNLLIGLDMFVDHPVLGVGTGNYQAHYLRYFFRHGWTPFKTVLAAHNLYITVLAEGGLVGAALFLILMLFSFRQLRRTVASRLLDLSNAAASVRQMLIMSLVAGMAVPMFYQRQIWLILGTTAALGGILISQRFESEQSDTTGVEPNRTLSPSTQNTP